MSDIKDNTLIDLVFNQMNDKIKSKDQIEIVDVRIKVNDVHTCHTMNCTICDDMIAQNAEYGIVEFLCKIINEDNINFYCCKINQEIMLQSCEYEFDFDNSNEFDVNDELKNTNVEILDMLEYPHIPMLHDYYLKLEFTKRMVELGELGKQYVHHTYLPYSKFIASKTKKEEIVEPKKKHNKYDKKQKKRA